MDYAMQTVADELNQRWLLMFEALARGEDLPPGVRLRTEGLMEALVLSGVASEAELQATMDARHVEVFGDSIAAIFGDDWRVLFPFPQIPAVARRAPVYPSTKD